MKKFALVPAFVALATSVPALAQTATGPDFSSLTDGVDVGTTTAALMSVGAVLIGVAVATMGIRKILRMVRGG